MKLSKKWILSTLVILGIGSFWLIENTWVFEKKISVDDYDNFINNTKWINDERNRTWEFRDGRIIMDSLISEKYEIGTYTIERSKLSTKTVTKNNIYEFDVYGNWKIKFLGHKTLLLIGEKYYDNNIKLHKI